MLHLDLYAMFHGCLDAVYQESRPYLMYVTIYTLSGLIFLALQVRLHWNVGGQWLSQWSSLDILDTRNGYTLGLELDQRPLRWTAVLQRSALFWASWERVRVYRKSLYYESAAYYNTRLWEIGKRSSYIIRTKVKSILCNIKPIEDPSYEGKHYVNPLLDSTSIPRAPLPPLPIGRHHRMGIEEDTYSVR